MTTPGFYAIIPANVRYCKDLEPNAKLLYGELTALAVAEGYCWASNEYFAELYDVDSRTIQRWLKSLHDQKFIEIEIEKNGMISSRKIWISQEIQKMFTMRQKCHPPTTKMSPSTRQKCHPINTVINNTEENKKELYVPDAEASGLAAQLLRVIKITKANIKEPKINDWAQEIERMIRIDKRDPVAIGKVIGWLPQNAFWAKNILSADKLRKQFDRLEIEMATERTQKTSFVNKKHRDSYDPTINAPKPISKDEQLVNLGVLFGASKPKDLK